MIEEPPSFEAVAVAPNDWIVWLAVNGDPNGSNAITTDPDVGVTDTFAGAPGAPTGKPLTVVLAGLYPSELCART